MFRYSKSRTECILQLNKSVYLRCSDFIGCIEDPKLSNCRKDWLCLAPAGPFGPVSERYASHLFTAEWESMLIQRILKPLGYSAMDDQRRPDENDD